MAARLPKRCQAHSSTFSLGSALNCASRDWTSSTVSMPVPLIGSGSSRFLPEHSRAPITKTFRRLAFLHEPLQDGTEFIFQLIDFQGFLIEPVQPRARLITTHINLVLARGFADESDLGHVGPGASVRAASHANNDLLIVEADLREQLLKPRDDLWQGPLR